MHAVSTNQIVDILHYNDNRKYYHWYSQRAFKKLLEDCLLRSQEK